MSKSYCAKCDSSKNKLLRFGNMHDYASVALKSKDVMKYRDTDVSVYRTIVDENRNHPEDIAIIFRGHRNTYRELLAQADLVSNILTSMNIRKGDIILLGANSPQAVSILLICQSEKIHRQKSFIALKKILQRAVFCWNRGDILSTTLSTGVVSGTSMFLLIPLMMGLTVLQSPRYPSVNPFVSYCTIVVCDHDTLHELPFGEAGEVFIHTPTAMREYLYDPKGTKELFVRDEFGEKWIRTGDLGILNRSGENI